jgi:hypothetical protein
MPYNLSEEWLLAAFVTLVVAAAVAFVIVSFTGQIGRLIVCLFGPVFALFGIPVYAGATGCGSNCSEGTSLVGLAVVVVVGLWLGSVLEWLTRDRRRKQAIRGE